ncbi:hypothetical protein [Pseudoalteromonas sp. T1lg122]|uniref:hypothetical protein n=1 Tax=Pseudoalteromonas sp. T1lg122 TaxID=2077094 RepID=UPI000CF61C15|nr:hypothetical protein [Pseudoalteromonas sp. T1lg122]
MDYQTASISTLSSTIIFFLFYRFFFSSYLKEKGKNLATKEDISTITTAVERVRLTYNEKLQELIHQNNILLESQKSNNQLKMIIPEKRMQAHQEAFELWRKIISNLHSDKVSEVVLECQSWYNKNCLYLASDARKAFSLSYGALAIHNDLLQNRSNIDHIKKNYIEIMSAGEVIVAGVDLPPLRADKQIVSKDENGRLNIGEAE